MINYVCSRMPLGEHHITTGIHIENKNSENLAGTICTEPGNKPSDNYIIDNDNITYSKEVGYLVDGTIVKKDTENYIEWEEKGKLDIDCRAYKDDKISGAIVTSNKNKVVTIGNYMPSNHNASRIVDNEGLAPTVMENHGTVTATNVNNLRIRKLIPLETWRLMGFDREDFIKAEQVNSNTQLYKQAGNSIVVNVLEYVLAPIVKKEEV